MQILENVFAEANIETAQTQTKEHRIAITKIYRTVNQQFPKDSLPKNLLEKEFAYGGKEQKKVLQHIHKQTPHKDRLLLVILFAVFAFTVVLDLTIMAEDALVHLS